MWQKNATNAAVAEIGERAIPGNAIWLEKESRNIKKLGAWSPQALPIAGSNFL